jgi:hypothetical protein
VKSPGSGHLIGPLGSDMRWPRWWSRIYSEAVVAWQSSLMAGCLRSGPLRIHRSG